MNIQIDWVRHSHRFASIIILITFDYPAHCYIYLYCYLIFESNYSDINSGRSSLYYDVLKILSTYKKNKLDSIF